MVAVVVVHPEAVERWPASSQQPHSKTGCPGLREVMHFYQERVGRTQKYRNLSKYKLLAPGVEMTGWS